MSEKFDVVISFDTTGSMYSCINEVKKNIVDILARLPSDKFRIGIIAHGDYCDEKTTYLMKQIDLTEDRDLTINFVKSIENTGGGDYPEAYEYVLHHAQKLSWQSDSLRALVMIGDAYPHEKNQNPYKLDWRHEVDEIKKCGINIYSVQALHSGNGKSYMFYKHMAQSTNGYHLFLDQFSYVRDMLLAICFKQMGDGELEKYEQEVKEREYGMTLSMRKMFDTMMGRTNTVDDSSKDDGKIEYDADSGVLTACPPSKYQILKVDEDMSIKEFVIKNGATFKAGKGYYEFTKPETISEKKLIVLMKKDTGELFEGKHAKKLAGITVEKRYKPSDLTDYRVFIQSTSYNRKLIKGTGFLYEASDWGI